MDAQISFRKERGFKGSIKDNVPFTLEDHQTMRSPVISSSNPMMEKTDIRSYRGMFYSPETAATFNTGGFKDLRDFFSAVASGRRDERLERRGFIEGTGQFGGFSVPEALAGQIIDESIEEEAIRPRATVYPMTTATLNVVGWHGTDHSQSVYGGFAAQWNRGEENEGDLQTGQLRRVQFNAHECILMSEASNEVLEDGPGFQNWLRMGLQKAVGHFIDSAYINGDGVSKPLGIINSACTIAVNRATANQIGYADLVGMFARLGGAFKNNAVWLINHDCVEQILQLTDTLGNLVWNVNARGGAAADLPTTIFGRPVIWTERVPALGSEGDVVLCDPRQYGVGMRKEITLAVSPHVHFTKNTTVFRCIVRTDGNGLWDAPITPQNGTATVSPFVVLK